MLGWRQYNKCGEVFVWFVFSWLSSFPFIKWRRILTDNLCFFNPFGLSYLFRVKYKWGPYAWKTYKQVYQEVLCTGSALSSQGVQPVRKFLLLGSIIYEWIFFIHFLFYSTLINYYLSLYVIEETENSNWWRKEGGERHSIFSLKKICYDECIIYCLVRVGKSLFCESDDLVF